MDEHADKIKTGLAQKIWIKLCSFFVNSFYKKIEITGSEILDQDKPIILCANHSNALADAVLLQYSSDQLIHPLARSGLFKNPFLKIILIIWQAVPVYRRQDAVDGEVNNDQMFRKVHQMLEKNQIIMVFPEGQSHSDGKLRQIRTGISRIVLSYKDKYGSYPDVVPVGLNFSHTTKFRSNVYINYGQAITIDGSLQSNDESHIKRLTDNVMEAMRDVIIETDEADDLAFVSQLERFFALRHKKIRRRNLSQKFKSHKLLLNVKSSLNQHIPDEINKFKLHLKQFNRLCRKLGINDYNLNITYNSRLIRRFILKSLFTMLIMLPVGIWGFSNSFLPFYLTQILSGLFSKTDDQRDTSKILTGTFLFIAFWGLQTYLAYVFIGLYFSLIYFISLVPASLVALVIWHEHAKIIDNLRVFFILIKKKGFRRYLIKKRKIIEQELAGLLKQARRYKA